MNEIRRIALDFAVLSGVREVDDLIATARKIEAYLVDEAGQCAPEMRDHAGREIAEPHVFQRCRGQL